jgi:hypothetical protein
MKPQRYVSEDRTLRDVDLMYPYGNEGRSIRVVLEADHVAEVATLRASLLTMEADHLIAMQKAEERITAMQQILDQWTNRENIERLIELAQEANALMFDNGQRDERTRILTEFRKIEPTLNWEDALAFVKIVEGGSDA